MTGAGELVACQHDLAFHMRRDAGRPASNGVFLKSAGLYEQDKSGNGRRCVEVPEVAEPDMKYCNNRTDPGPLSSFVLLGCLLHLRVFCGCVLK